MIAVLVRPPGAPWRVIGAGQSLWNHPAGSTILHFAMAGRGVPSQSVATDAAPWATELANIATDLYPQLALADDSIVGMLGGQTDIELGSTAQQVYDRMVSYATLAKANGATFVVAMTMPPFPSFSAEQEEVRLALNELIRDDADGAFDDFVDLAADPRLTDTANLVYFEEDGHLNIEGARVAAELLDPVLDARLASA